jgi:hypothetical protein
MGFLRRTWTLASLCACVPDVDVDLALVEAPRLLAVSATPAEAAPGDTVQWTALVGAPEGTLEDPDIDWRLCATPRPLAELGPVARACVDEAAAGASLGRGGTVTGALPMDACRRFGPETPPAMPGTAPGRPADPDGTGGYHQPVIARAPDTASPVTLFGTRLSCGIAGATQRQAAEFQRRHVPNAAPIVASLERIGGSAIAIDDAVLEVEPGEEVILRVGWPACPDEPTCTEDCEMEPGCAGAEPYLFFDPIALELRSRREGIGVAWYGTAGHFEHASTGRAEDDPATSSDNTWTAPDQAQDVSLWIVLRDDRGGVGWASATVHVGP